MGAPRYSESPIFRKPSVPKISTFSEHWTFGILSRFITLSEHRAFGIPGSFRHLFGDKIRLTNVGTSERYGNGVSEYRVNPRGHHVNYERYSLTIRLIRHRCFISWYQCLTDIQLKHVSSRFSFNIFSAQLGAFLFSLWYQVYIVYLHQIKAEDLEIQFYIF